MTKKEAAITFVVFGAVMVFAVMALLLIMQLGVMIIESLPRMAHLWFGFLVIFILGGFAGLLRSEL